MLWEQLHHVSGFLVDCTLLAAAVMAVVRFRLFNVLGHRWRSDLTCMHWDQDDGSVIFTADYTLQNTGSRPLQIRAVSLTLAGANSRGSCLLQTVNAPWHSEFFAQRIKRYAACFRLNPVSGQSTRFDADYARSMKLCLFSVGLI